MSVDHGGNNLRFLTGGGEMGALTRAKDWSKTTLGPPAFWPQSFRTALSIVLNSRFPMFLWWGPELICFYNDAYRPSLGQNGKHPTILGMPAEAAWSEIWGVIKPLIDQVLTGGEATWSEDQLIPIYRNGKIEDVYWTFSYSPVNDESGQVAGVLVTCTETTEKVNTFRHLEESNRRYLDNILHAPVAMCIFRDRNHIVEIANEKMLELWGKKSDEVLNKPIFEGLPEAKGQGLEAIINEVYTTGKRFVADERPVNLPRNGKTETTYINFVYEALKEPDGQVSGVVATATDVTMQVIARKEIESSGERFRTLAETLPELVWETDEKGNALFASRKWQEYSGVEPGGEAEWRAVVHPDDYESNKKTWIHCLQTGQVYKSDVRLKSKTGEYRWHTVNGEAVRDKNGKIIKWVGAFTDTDAEKIFTSQLEEQVENRTIDLEKARKNLEVKNEELAKMNQELQSFAYVSSHDLQEPLRKIQTFTERILKRESEALSEAGKSDFERIQNAAGRMQQLINDLLSYSRASTSERKYEYTDLKAIIEQVKEDLKDDIRQKHAVIETEGLGQVNIIPFQFHQLLSNLISNSLKFSSEERKPLIIIKSNIADAKDFGDENLTEGSKYCHITISDNGIGFEPRYSKRIFEVFQRLHGRSEYSGTGIGLAIVKKIVENHNGLITAHSEPEKGATFDIFIPA